MKHLSGAVVALLLLCGLAFAEPIKSTAVTVTNASTQALASGARTYLALLNQDSAKTIACSLGGTAVVNGAGSIVLGPNGGGFVWDSANVPGDAVNCIASVTGALLTIISKAP